MLILFGDSIADKINYQNIHSIATELFIRDRKLNILLAFITQSYFKVPKYIRLMSRYYFIMKIPNKRNLPQIVINHSSDIDFKDFMKIYKKCTAETYFFLVDDTIFPSGDPF